MDRTELLAKMQEVGDIGGRRRAAAVLQAVLNAFRSEGTSGSARRVLGRQHAEPEPDWRLREACQCDLFDREEMLCEEDVSETH